jgi:hypothetical protein
MILLQHCIGRLVEARFATPIERTELDEFDSRRARLRTQLAGERIVVMDFRRASILPPELADKLVGLLHGPNPGLLRNAVLIPSASATVAMQLTRIVREADDERRRVFRGVPELEEWLGEVLSGPERQRLRELLADQPLANG